MKVIAFLIATLSFAAAFAPATFGTSRRTTELSETFFDTVFGMDLFAPNKQVNDYGARNKKNLKSGKIGTASYVPNGLTAAQYQKIRDGEAAKKAKNYQAQASKAFKNGVFAEFLSRREKGDAWIKEVGRGHTFAKVKYTNLADGKKYDGSAV